MADSGIYIAWGRTAPGKDPQAMELYQRLSAYMRTLHAEGRIDSFDPVMLGAHGSDISGFVLIRGERDKLDEIRNSPQFREFVVRGNIALTGFRVVRAHFGREVEQLLATYQRIALER